MKVSSRINLIQAIKILLLTVILLAANVVIIVYKTEYKATNHRAVDPLFRDFVKVCGVHLCINSQQWEPYFASTYAAKRHPDWDINTAVEGHLNTIRVNNYLNMQGDPATAPYDEAHWEFVDHLIASARSEGLHVLLDLSVYRNLTSQDETQNAYLVDWKPFLTFVINRVNTVTQVRYGNDTTIAMFALAGEVAPPHGSNKSQETTQQINDFFARTALEFKVLDKNHILSPGGLYQLGWDSGIDYKTIFSIPAIDVCAVHAPPDGSDAPITSRYCGSIHKPWIWEEFFQPQGIGDQARAQFYQQTYDAGRQLNDAGIGFWNLGPGLGAENDDVGPQTPLTWQIVIKNAPPPS